MSNPPVPEQQVSFFELIGGHETFHRLVHRFYAGVASDPEFRAMYPEEDLGPAEDRLRLFLEQYWGGPSTYGEQRGHPRLRMRHMPFHIDEAARDRWLHHMEVAVDELDLDPTHREILWEYFTRVAHFLINAPTEGQGSQPAGITITRRPD